jgi:hypothetical protein
VVRLYAINGTVLLIVLMSTYPLSLNTSHDFISIILTNFYVDFFIYDNVRNAYKAYKMPIGILNFNHLNRLCLIHINVQNDTHFDD